MSRVQADESRRRIRLETAAVVVGILAFVALTLGPSLLGLRVFAGLDLLRQYLPYSRANPLTEPVTSIFIRDTIDGQLWVYADFHRRLFEGDFASWLPYSGGGAPLGALPSFALLSPVSLAYWLLPTWLAPAYTELLQIAVGIGGTFLFLRRLSCARAAALLGGLVFVTCGYMVAWENWPQTRVGAFIPVLFWALERFVQLRTARSAVPIAVAVAGLLFGGFPAVAGLTLYAGGGYLLVRLLADRRVRGLLRSGRDAVLAGVAVVLGVGVAAVQLLPFVSYLDTLDLSYRTTQFFNTTPLKYATTAVFPQAFFANQYGPDSPFSREINPIEINTYIGSVALLLIALAVLRAGAVRRPRGALTFLLATSAAALWLIFVQGPLVDWLDAVPVFAGNPIGRIRAVLGFTAAAAAGLGFDSFVRGVRTAGWRSTAERVLVPGGLAGLLVVGYLVDRAQTPLLGGQVRRDVLIACAAAVLAGALILAAARWKPARLAALVVVPLLVAGQGVVAVQNFWPTSDPSEFYPTTAAHRFLADHTEGYRVAAASDVLVPSTTGYYGINTVGGHSFFTRTWAQLLSALDPGAFVAPTIATLDPRRPELASQPGLDRLAVRYYVSGDMFPIPGTRVQTGDEDGRIPVSGAAPVRTTIMPTGLRGIGIRVASAAGPFRSDSQVTVELTDSRGNLIARGTRPIPNAIAPSEIYLPLVAEDAGERPGPWTVTATFTGTPDLVLRAARGQPQLVEVRPVEDGLTLVDVVDGVTIYQRSGALPRIRWAAQTLVVPDPDVRVGVVARGRYPADTVVLSAPGEAADAKPADVQVLEDSGDTIRVRLRAQGAGYLVVADAIQTDWTAAVDGLETPIEDADHALGAVHVEAGQHDVVLRYTPAGRPTGAAISLGSLVLLGLMCLPARGWVARRRRPVGVARAATEAEPVDA